ncbi:acyl-CoA desaturase, partial [Aspergillus neoniger CBS 115656]
MEAHKLPPLGEQRVHISQLPMTWRNWYKHLNWWGIILTIVVPLYGCLQAFSTPLQKETAIWSVLYYFCTGFGITAGYHRLWAHASYGAFLPLKVFLALMGAGAGEGSIRWWARAHRSHHRHTDTSKDPYSVNKGLLYSHMGWLIFKQNPKRLGRVDTADLNVDAVVVWQHRNYLVIILATAFLLPTLVSGLGWGDWKGGFIYAGILRMFFVHQATFCVNSLAHWLGEQPFDDRRSSRDHLITALLALGEGYHNFHHSFPSGYRNAEKWWQYDATKWIIWIWGQLGLAYDLKTFAANEILKCRLQKRQKLLDHEKLQLDWGIPIESLPVIQWRDYIYQTEVSKRPLIVISGIVHDVSRFMDTHPGGRIMIQSGIGKDATSMFKGGVYMHSKSAHNQLAKMRVAVIYGGGEDAEYQRQE